MLFCREWRSHLSIRSVLLLTQRCPPDTRTLDTPQAQINEAEFRFLASGCCTRVLPPSKKRKALAVQPVTQAQINEAEFRFLARGCCTRVLPPSKKRKALAIQPVTQAQINEAEFRFLASGCCTRVLPPS